MISRVIAFAGYSNSGKTTVICDLIARFHARGIDVGAIKHTHHPLDAGPGGDTGRFLAAGARAAILADDREAILFSPSEDLPRRFSWREPSELVEQIRTEIVFVEGFKRVGIWPRILIRGADGLVPSIDPTVIATIGRIPVPGDVQHFNPGDREGLAGFLDRILDV